jgi:hypothetical protein
VERSGFETLNETLNQFVESDLEPYGLPGTGVVTGQAFLKTMGGDVKYGAGNVVQIWPATAFFEERFDKKHIQGKRIPDLDTETEAKLAPFRRTVIADGFGNFEFRDLPVGKYLIACQITWLAGQSMTGGFAVAKATVADGQTVKVVVTR